MNAYAVFKGLHVAVVIEASGASDAVEAPGNIKGNQLAHLSESLARFKPPRNRQRKRRTIFSPAATSLLEHEFATDCYPDNSRLQQLAQRIGHGDISAIQVSLERLELRKNMFLRTPWMLNLHVVKIEANI